jgi:uncharacterized protein
MSGTLTVSLRSLVLVATLILGVAGAYAVGAARSAGAGPQPVSTLAQASVPAGQHGIVVRGTGEALGVPDQVRFSLTARATADDLSAAVAEANSTARTVLRALRADGVARADVRTTGLSMHPVLDYGDDGPPQVVGYAAAERFSVLVRELPTAGAVISAAVEAGGDAVRLHDVRLQIGAQRELVRRARAAAFAEARDTARQYAAASGRDLGEVVSVREHVPGGGRQELLGFERGTATARLLGKVPVQAGQQQVRVSVTLVWAFA